MHPVLSHQTDWARGSSLFVVSSFSDGSEDEEEDKEEEEEEEGWLENDGIANAPASPMAKTRGGSSCEGGRRSAG